jgi:hypothetical protein
VLRSKHLKRSLVIQWKSVTETRNILSETYEYLLALLGRPIFGPTHFHGYIVLTVTKCSEADYMGTFPGRVPFPVIHCTQRTMRFGTGLFLNALERCTEFDSVTVIFKTIDEHTDAIEFLIHGWLVAGLEPGPAHKTL